MRAAQLVVALLANADDLDSLAFGGQRVRLLARQTNDRRVERAAETAFAGADDEEVGLACAGADEQAGTLAVGGGAA